MSAVQKLDQKWYPDLHSGWDNTLFREVIDIELKPEFEVLDLGCGRGMLPQMDLKGKVAFIAGVDPDKAVFDNPYLDEAKQLPLPSGDIPYENGCFDMIVSNNVLEHIEDPGKFLSEVERVLKPGGIFLGKTPNKRHYVPLISALTPLRFHKWINKKRGRDEEDTFPTHYRLNTEQDIRNATQGTLLDVAEVQLIEGRPEYLRFNPITYFCGFLYERIVNRFASLKRFRCVLVVKLQKRH